MVSCWEATISRAFVSDAPHPLWAVELCMATALLFAVTVCGESPSSQSEEMPVALQIKAIALLDGSFSSRSHAL